MQGVKISRVGRILALATPSYSCGHHNGRIRKTKEERRIMIESFVEKYKASNKGEFPSVTFTLKEVGGTFYTVREILQELKQQHVSYDNLRTDLEATETKNQTTRHTVQPLSLPAESANEGVIDNHHSLELKEAKYPETLTDTKEKENVIHNDVIRTCGLNDQTRANQEINIVEGPQGTSAASFVVDPQPLQEVTKGQSISSVSNGVIESNHSLEPSGALSDPEEQKNIIHNDFMEICSANDQTQAKQKIKIVERPLGATASSVVMDLQVTNGQSISSASTGVRDNNHKLELTEAEYLEALSDTEELKNIIHNDVMGTCSQTRAKQGIKIVERPLGTSPVAVVVGMQSLQEAVKGQPISSVSGGVINSNHNLELNGAKYHEALSDAEEQENIIHNDVMETCGPNDQSHRTQVKQEIQIIERPLVTSAASIVVGLQPLQEATKGQSLEKEVKNQPRSFILDENQKNKDTNEIKSLFQISEKENVRNRNVMESYSSSVEDFKYESSEADGKECNLTHDINSSPSISLDACLPELQSSELGSNSLENQNLSGSFEELEHAFPKLSENGSMFGTQKITSPCSPMENNSSYIEASERGEEHLPLNATEPLSLSSDSHPTTCVTESPKDLSYSADHVEENALVPNTTKRMPEQPAGPADKVISSMTDLITAPGQATEIPDNSFEDQKLASSKISPDQVLTGVKAFYGVLLHRLALSALVIQTLVDAADASKKGSSEFESENLDGYSLSKCCRDLTDKKEFASLAASLPLDQSGSIGDIMQSTQKNSDGICTDNSESKIGPFQDQGESIGDITQSSLNNFSDASCTDILENKNGTYTNTESSRDPEKLETNIILDFFNNIGKGIFYLLKKQAKKPHGK